MPACRQLAARRLSGAGGQQGETVGQSLGEHLPALAGPSRLRCRPGLEQTDQPILARSVDQQLSGLAEMQIDVQAVGC